MRKQLAAVATTALLLAGGAACSEGESASPEGIEQSTTTNVVDAVTETTLTELERREQLFNQAAITASLSVIEAMQAPGAGIREYNQGFTHGNSDEVKGNDGEYGTGDELVPGTVPHTYLHLLPAEGALTIFSNNLTPDGRIVSFLVSFDINASSALVDGSPKSLPEISAELKNNPDSFQLAHLIADTDRDGGTVGYDIDNRGEYLPEGIYGHISDELIVTTSEVAEELSGMLKSNG